MAPRGTLARSVAMAIPVPLAFISLIDPRLVWMGGPAVVAAAVVAGLEMRSGEGRQPP